MVQSPSWEANWFAASQESPRILWNPKVHYRTHKRPPPDPSLRQPNPVHIPTSYNLYELAFSSYISATLDGTTIIKPHLLFFWWGGGSFYYTYWYVFLYILKMYLGVLNKFCYIFNLRKRHILNVSQYSLLLTILSV